MVHLTLELVVNLEVSIPAECGTGFFLVLRCEVAVLTFREPS
jgi:hypothetical protein